MFVACFVESKLGALSQFLQTVCPDVEFDVNLTDLEEGKPVPADAVVFDMNNNELKVADITKGTVTVVAFWATYGDVEQGVFLRELLALAAKHSQDWKGKVSVLIVSVDDHIKYLAVYFCNIQQCQT